jgi:putative nucleotidyltransferase with HDIG domain
MLPAFVPAPPSPAAARGARREANDILAAVPDDLVHDRDAAWSLLTEWTQSEALRRHALAVEASTRAYADRFGEDADAWGNVALLHDFDWERHPSLEQHPQEGSAVLRERGYPDWFVRAILSHAEHTGVPRQSRLEHTLFACDEMSGFVHACGLVRPDGIATLEPRSVKKKLKQPSFARGVKREDVLEGAKELGVELDEHIAFVIAALRPISAELGLPG